MGKLIYSAIASADGYVEDAAGSFDWAAPDEELLRLVNDLERPVGTYLYPLRAPDVRDDALLGDRSHGAGPAVFRPGVRRHLAGSLEDRIFEDPEEGAERQDAARTELRSRSSRATEVGHRA